MSKLRRSIATLASAMALASGAVILTTRAADQGGPATAAQATPATQPARVPSKAANATALAPGAFSAANNKTSDAERAAAKPAAAKPPAPGAPQVPEESATIRDDPTIAPDPKQSADNNVSFPSDI